MRVADALHAAREMPFETALSRSRTCVNNNNKLQLGCHPVAVVILHVYTKWNWLLINLIREDYIRSM